MNTFDNGRLNWSVFVLFAAVLLATELGFLQRGMNLGLLDFSGWLFCTAVASLILWVSEIYKWLAKP